MSGMQIKFSSRLNGRTVVMDRRKVSARWWQGLTAPTLFLGLASTVLALLGYGVARSNDAIFGISYPLWYDTPLDLMAMSGDSFIGWLDRIEKAVRSISTWHAAAGAGVVIACMATLFAVGQWFRTTPQACPWRQRAALLRDSCATWFFTPKVKFGEQVAHATVTAAAACVIGGLSALFGLLVLLAVIAAICLIPLLGFIGGAAYARASIIDPPSCISPIAVRLRAKSTNVGAPCVAVTDPATGKTVLGRLILARGSRVFIYSKVEDRAYMYTIKEVSISSVHVLPTDVHASQGRWPGRSSVLRTDL